MATRDNHTYGFNRADAQELTQLIGGADGEYPEGRVRGVGGGDKHYLYTLTGGSMSGSSQTATIRNMADDTEIDTSQPVVNTLSQFTGLANGARGVCIRQGGTYYAIGPYVVDVRWDSPDLEQTKDGTTYTNIDTAETCT